eukprot:5335421-Pleurochrysis_carterae.AAC.1
MRCATAPPARCVCMSCEVRPGARSSAAGPLYRRATRVVAFAAPGGWPCRCIAVAAPSVAG